MAASSKKKKPASTISTATAIPTTGSISATTNNPTTTSKTGTKVTVMASAAATTATPSGSALRRKKKSSWLNRIITIVSFLLGVLTPPLRYYVVSITSGGRSLMMNDAENADIDPSDDPIVVLPPRSCNHDAEEFFHLLGDEAVPGQHVMCLTFSGKLTVFRNSMATLAYNTDARTETWASLTHQLDSTLNLPHRRYNNQAWVIFTKDGRRIVDETYVDDEKNAIMMELKKEGVFVLMEGGVWIWPGIAKGHTRQVSLNYIPGVSSNTSQDDAGNATLVTLSLYPLVFSVQGFLSDEECTYIQEQATPQMQYSGVTLMDKDKGRPASDFRTSQTAFLGGSQYNEGLKKIDARTASLVRIPQSHQEYVQVLRYGLTEKYNAHCDYFDPAMYKNDANTMRMIEDGKKNRLATVFWYLSDVPRGGHTIFPRVDKGPHPSSTADCTKGLKVKPERGKVIIFYSMTPEGGVDEYSLHGACPVEEGIKWAANKWVWNKPTGFYP